MEVLRLSDRIANDLESRILEGSLRPGERLPPERTLAEQLGVSRPSLREALLKLASKGLLQTRHGGGTVVTDRLMSSFADPWRNMLDAHPDLSQDILEFRHMLEAQAAQLAADRASPADLERIDAAYATLEAAYAGHDLDACCNADVEFHQTIAESSHNALIAHLSASLHRLVHELVQTNLRHLSASPRQWTKLQAQHRAIWERVRTRQAEPAADAARQHVAFVQQTLQDTARAVAREASARRRIKAA